ncbi:hypothetical protein L7F22_057502 [Adiantum nelumboides]|nr:hypothetical protein [Adiantum nelumboides]
MVTRRRQKQQQRLWVRLRSFRSFILLLFLLCFLLAFTPALLLRLLSNQRLARKCRWLWNRPLVCAHGGDTSSAPPNTTCVEPWGQVRDHQSLVFFDPGARANFVTPQLAEKMGIKTNEMGPAYTASMAAPGHEVGVMSLIGKLRLHIQGYVGHEEFYIVPLEGCDVLLGMPWFYNHKAVLDSFNKTITLEIRGRKIVLDVKHKGESMSLVSASAVPRLMKQHISAYLIYVKERDEIESSNLSSLDVSRRAFLDEYADCFSEALPGRLPLERSEDHSIDLIPGSAAPNKPPYRVSAPNKEIMTCPYIPFSGYLENRDGCTVISLLEAYDQALLAEVDCVEIDASRSQDGVLVALHDRDLQNMYGNDYVQVGDLSFKEIVRLDAAQNFPNKSQFQMVPTLVNAVQAGYIVMKDEVTGKMTSATRMYTPEVVGVYHGLITANFVKRIHKRGKRVFSWTVDDRETMRKMLYDEVDAIVTSQPRLLQELMLQIQNECFQEGFTL